MNLLIFLDLLFVLSCYIIFLLKHPPKEVLVLLKIYLKDNNQSAL